MPLSETDKREFANRFLTFALAQINILKIKQVEGVESEQLQELTTTSLDLRSQLIKQLFDNDSEFKFCDEATKLRGQFGAIALLRKSTDFFAICLDFVNVLFNRETEIKEKLIPNLEIFLKQSFSLDESERLLNWVFAQSSNRAELTTISPNELRKQDLVKSILNLAAIHCNIIQLKAKLPDIQDPTDISLYLRSNPEISDEFFLNTTIISTLVDEVKAALSAIKENYEYLFKSDQLFALSYQDLTNNIFDALTTNNPEDAKSVFKDIILRSSAMLDQSRFVISLDQIESILTNSREVSERLIHDIFNETTATVSDQRPSSTLAAEGFDESKFRDKAAFVGAASGGGLSSSPTSSLRAASGGGLSASAEEKQTCQSSDTPKAIDDINERAKTIIDLLGQYLDIKKSSQTPQFLINSIIEHGILDIYLSATFEVDQEQLEAKVIEEIFNKPGFVERVELQAAKEEIEILVSNQSQFLRR